MKHIPTVIRVLFLALFLLLIVTGHMLLWLILYAVSLLLAPLFGRLYCGYACPMNTLMIPVSWLSGKTRLCSEKTPGWLAHGYFSYAALIVSIAAILLSKLFLHAELPILPFWLVLALLITLRYKPAVFHNLICPFGVLQKTAGRFALLSKRVLNDACVGCKVCESACPSGAIRGGTASKNAVIDTALCHQCRECKTACKKNAIIYGRKP